MRGVPPKPAVVYAIRDAYRDGVSQCELGRRFALHRTTVARLVTDITRGPGGYGQKRTHYAGGIMTEDFARKIRHLYSSGCSTREIARWYDTTHSTVLSVVAGRTVLCRSLGMADIRRPAC